MTNWSDQQVGGSHYRQHGNEFQHWDFVVAAGLGYFEGQVTRYVVRYRQPDGGEGEKDLRKAIHYIGKLHSVCPCYIGGRAGMYARTAKWVQKFAQAHELNLMEQAIIQLVAGWQTPEDLVSARSGIEDLLKHWLSRGHDLYQTGDPDTPDVIKDRNGDVVLGLCRRCGRGEIQLSEPCDPKPVPLTEENHYGER